MKNDGEAIDVAANVGQSISHALEEDFPEVRFFVAVFDAEGHAGAYSTGDFGTIKRVLRDFLTAK